MNFDWDPENLAFARDHLWGVLATGRRDGSPQQSMVGYVVDDEGRLVVSAKAYTAKWKNAMRQPRVSFLIPDGRVQLIVYGEAEGIDAEPERAELTASIFAALSGGDAPDPDSIVPMLDEQQRTIIRISPDKVFFHE
ncbi:MAG: pyridoxamine 5'-phosphate oxidase family protein [Actinomycetota bacterium]